MNVFLVGATGGTGKIVLQKLVAVNHRVSVLARNPDSVDIPANPGKVKIIKGSVYTPEVYQDELAKCDLVISALGTGTARGKTDIYSRGGQCIIEAMKKAGIKKLITLTPSALDPTAPQYNHFIVRFIVRPLFKNIYADMQQWESIQEANRDIDWICIRPSRLTNGKEKGQYRIAINYSPKGGWQISREDLADFILTQVTSDQYIHQKPAIAW